MRLDAVLAFQNIRPNRTLRQELNAVQLPGLLSKDLDKLTADNFPLGLRVGNPCQLVKEPVHGVHINEVRVHLVAEHLDNLLRLSLAKQAMVHMNADQLLADGFNQQRRHYAGIHAAGQRQQYLLVPYLLPNLRHLGIDKCLSLLRRGNPGHVLRTVVKSHWNPSDIFDFLHSPSPGHREKAESRCFQDGLSGQRIPLLYRN